MSATMTSPLLTALFLAGASRAQKPSVEPGPHQLWEWIETHQAVVYPIVAVAIIGLIVGALLTSWKADSMDAERKGQLKMQILQIIRRRVSGVSAANIAAELQLDVRVAGQLLNELDEEGLVRSSKGSGNAPVQYRIRGGV